MTLLTVDFLVLDWDAPTVVSRFSPVFPLASNVAGLRQDFGRPPAGLRPAFGRPPSLNPDLTVCVIPG